MYRSRKLRGQLSFEFILILALFLGVTAAIANDFFSKSLDTTIMASVRQTADRLVNENALSTPSCSGDYVDYIFYDNISSVDVYTKKCLIDVRPLSQLIEKNDCGNNAAALDNVIACGSKSYSVRSLLS